MKTASEIKELILTAWVNGEAPTIDDILKRWGQSIIKTCTRELVGMEYEDSEVYQELNDQL